jgi:hypothetical protein
MVETLEQHEIDVNIGHNEVDLVVGNSQRYG